MLAKELPELRILITGARGFIGRHLINRLLRCSDTQIFALDVPGDSKREHSYQSLSVDMSLPGWSEIICEPMDTVVHLAQSLRYRDFPEGAYDMVKININGTFELLEWCRKNSVKKFIFSSTGNVYKEQKQKLTENDICEPTSMYAATKLSAEHLVKQYSIFFQTIILRLFGIYGPGQSNMTIPNIIESVRKGNEITLAQKIGLNMTPLYISDCIEMIYKLIMDNNLGKNILLNMASSEAIHLGDIIKKIENYLNCKAIIKITDHDPKYLQGENKKIRETINYDPVVCFDEGIKNTLFNL
jgi:UDP-glucose 4-epimerase